MPRGGDAGMICGPFRSAWRLRDRSHCRRHVCRVFFLSMLFLLLLWWWWWSSSSSLSLFVLLRRAVSLILTPGHVLLERSGAVHHPEKPSGCLLWSLILLVFPQVKSRLAAGDRDDNRGLAFASENWRLRRQQEEEQEEDGEEEDE